jgi:hypothetical protein
MNDCKKCGKFFNTPSMLKRHIDRKYPCDIKYDINIANDKKFYCCQFCPKQYSKKIYLDNHIEKNHENTFLKESQIKIQNELDSIKLQLTEVLETMSKMTNTTNNTTNNVTSNSNNNTTNNVINNTINNFYKPNISYLVDYLSKPAILSEAPDLMKLIVKIFEIVHCNKDHPENHNVFQKDDKINFAMEDDKVFSYDYSYGITKIYKSCGKIIDDKFTLDELSPENRKKYKEKKLFIRDLNKTQHDKIMTTESKNPLKIEYKDSTKIISDLLTSNGEMFKNNIDKSNYSNADIIDFSKS